MVFVIFSESHSFLSYFVVILTDVLPQKLLQPGLAQHPDALLPQKPGGNAPARRQRAGERAVIYGPGAAGGAALLEDGGLRPGEPGQLQHRLRPRRYAAVTSAPSRVTTWSP